MDNSFKISKFQLFEARDKFECKVWRNTIKEILKDNINLPDAGVVEICDVYIDKLHEQGSDEEKEYVESLGVFIYQKHGIENAKKEIAALFESVKICLFDKDAIELCNDEMWICSIHYTNKEIVVFNDKINTYFKESYGYSTFKISKILHSEFLEKMNFKYIPVNSIFPGMKKGEYE